MAIDPNRVRGAIKYTADDGLLYRLITSHNRAAAVGATPAGATTTPLPSRWVPRHVHLTQTLAGRDRSLSLIVPDDTSALWTGGTNTVTVAPYGVFQVTGRIGEGRTQGAIGFDGVATPANERVIIKYRSENGLDYGLVTTRSHAAAVGATDGSAETPYPRIWTPRHYYLLNPALAGRDQKLRLVEPSPTAAAFLSDASFDFVVNGIVFRTTGRKEEHRPLGAPDYIP